MNTIVWLTGLSGAGKSTIANELRQKLWDESKIPVGIVDGDILRQIYGSVGFGEAGRNRNVLNGASLADHISDQCPIILITMMSPFNKARSEAIKFLKDKGYNILVVLVHCPMEELEKRDPKGLYKKFNDGIIKNLNGKDLPYEPPICPSLVLDTSQLTIAQAVKELCNLITINLLIDWSKP